MNAPFHHTSTRLADGYTSARAAPSKSTTVLAATVRYQSGTWPANARNGQRVDAAGIASANETRTQIRGGRDLA
jgi:hypothetical protein